MVCAGAWRVGVGFSANPPCSIHAPVHPHQTPSRSDKIPPPHILRGWQILFGDAAPLAQAPHATDSLPDPARVGPPEEAPSPHPLRHVLETAVDRHGVEATANALTSLLSQVPAGVGAGWVLLHAPLLGFLVLMATCGAWGAGLASQGTLRCGGAGGACMRALVPTDAMPCTPLARGMAATSNPNHLQPPHAWGRASAWRGDPVKIPNPLAPLPPAD